MNLIKKRLQQAVSSSFLKNIGKMMTGTGFAHLLGIAVLPMLTRLYTPEEIGVYSVFLSLLTIGMCAASLRYEYSILLPKNDIEADNITVLSVFLSLVFSVTLFFILLFLHKEVGEILKISSLGFYLLLLPVAVFIFSLLIIVTLSLNRYKKYGTISQGKILSSSGTSASQIVMGLLSLQSIGLIVGKMLGDFAGVCFLIWRKKKLQRSFIAGVSPSRMMAMAKRYKNFPLYNAPHVLTTNVSNSLPVLLFITFFGEAIAGFYGMAFKALYSPVQVISQATNKVFGQRLAEKFGKKEELLPFIKSTMLLLGVIGVLPFGLLFIAGPAIFNWFLGSGWETTGYYVRILSPYFFMVFIVTPLNFIPLMLGRQAKAFVLDLLYLFCRLAALGIGIYNNNIVLALVLYSFIGVCYLFYLSTWCYFIAKQAERSYLKIKRA